MIIALDHMVLLARDGDAASAAYERLLGLAPAWRTAGDGATGTLFTTANTSLEVLAPSGAGATGDRVRARIEEQGEGLASLAFQVDDIARYRRRLERVALAPEEIVLTESRDAPSGATLSWKRMRADTARTHGVRLFFLEMERARPQSRAVATGPVTSIDHVVVATHDSERAAALYGARLGLDMALDQRDANGRATIMFFRCGDMIVEVLNDQGVTGDDKLWGISWRVDDIEASNTRMAAAGFNVSEVRAGRRAGTRVFTVRDAPCGVATLVIETAKRG
jgi:catechol 2,3-dioxygenase-like lactoylglutathione lyase family enzyme